MMAKQAKAAITERALIQRINRKLWHDDEVLKTARSERARFDLGDYYVLDWRINGIVGKNVDPEEMGRELGVLKAWEKVAGADI
jgi:hypothetical protein